MRPKTDERIWYPDLNAVLDWKAVWDGTQKSYSENPLATWWIQATEGVNYYRAELPARHLPGKSVRFEPRDLQPRDDDGEPYFPRQEGSAAVWMFPGDDLRWRLLAYMKTLGYRVLVEVDDNYTRQPSIASMSSWATTRDLEGGKHSYEVHRKIVASEACDGVIVSTPKLADVYLPLNPNVHVCMNQIDPGDWEEPNHAPEGILRVGWAGSASHAYDVADIRPALDWASRQKDVEVVVLGQLDLGIEHTRVPWTDDLGQYRRNIGQLDVILCPLRPNEWADCKSDVKALEGVMGGAVPVVSRTEPFRPWWDRTYVADQKKDWLKIMRHLVANREETRQAAVAARSYVLSERTIAGNINSWREALSCTKA